MALFKAQQKKLLKSKVVQRFLTFIITRIIRIIYKTNKWEISYDDALTPYINGDKQAIFAFWHGRLIMMPNVIPKKLKFYVMISIHTDGEIIANCMKFFNIHLVRGSSRKGGTSALRHAQKVLLEENANLGITPDGPKGPRMKINSNVVALAKMTSAPIIPVTFSSSRAKILKSWDRFMLPFPFGKSVLQYGNPVIVPSDCDKTTMETLKIVLEEEMIRITYEADKSVGRAPIKPATKR